MESRQLLNMITKLQAELEQIKKLLELSAKLSRPLRRFWAWLFYGKEASRG